MPTQLHQYLLEFYGDGQSHFLEKGVSVPSSGAIQIDDQSDNDSLVEFCNIFCRVLPLDTLRIELYGKFPITDDMTAFADSHGGYADPMRGRLVLLVPADDVPLIEELARMIKRTARMGSIAGNSVWMRVSARTVSSLLRFGRVLRDYKDHGKWDL